jgi:hypothetical protein
MAKSDFEQYRRVLDEKETEGTPVVEVKNNKPVVPDNIDFSKFKRKIDPDSIEEESPLKFSERALLNTFATDEGVDKFLRQRFDDVKTFNDRKAVKTKTGWKFIDPKFGSGGFKEFLGDIADSSDEVLEGAGILLGGLGGGLVGGPGGALAGSAAAGAASQSLVELIGNSMGLRPDVGMGIAAQNVSKAMTENMLAELSGLGVTKIASAAKKKIVDKVYNKYIKNSWQVSGNSQAECQRKPFKECNQKELSLFPNLYLDSLMSL